CVQRLTQAQIEAKNAWVRGTDVEKAADARVAIPDAAIETACAQACPTDAIIFGDRNDPTSRVAAAQRRDRSYEMLEELNVKARTKYLAKVRNPAVPHAAEAGHGGGHGDGASGPGDDHAHSEAGQHS
ncbi:MAG: hypothetical protein KDA25_06635, partial [Phycisphaerales bacterium]|nr:hypothetical protein [Phycisphaerales bacterium]